MPKRFLAILLTPAVLILSCACSAHAQDQSLPRNYSVLDVVTTAQPNVRTRCTIAAIDDGKIACEGRHNHAVTYQKGDIAALIYPRYISHVWIVVSALLAGKGALIYAAIIASSIPATAGLSVAAFVVFGITGALLYGDDNERPYDEIVYQKTGTTLAVTLHLSPHQTHLTVTENPSTAR